MQGSCRRVLSSLRAMGQSVSKKWKRLLHTVLPHVLILAQPTSLPLVALCTACPRPSPPSCGAPSARCSSMPSSTPSPGATPSWSSFRWARSTETCCTTARATWRVRRGACVGLAAGSWPASCNSAWRLCLYIPAGYHRLPHALLPEDCCYVGPDCDVPLLCPPPASPTLLSLLHPFSQALCTPAPSCCTSGSTLSS